MHANLFSSPMLPYLIVRNRQYWPNFSKYFPLFINKREMLVFSVPLSNKQVIAALDSATEGLYTLLSVFPQQDFEKLCDRSRKGTKVPSGKIIMIVI